MGAALIGMAGTLFGSALGFWFSWRMQSRQHAFDREARRADFERKYAAELERSKLDARLECYQRVHRGMIELMRNRGQSPTHFIYDALGELNLVGSVTVMRAADRVRRAADELRTKEDEDGVLDADEIGREIGTLIVAIRKDLAPRTDWP